MAAKQIKAYKMFAGANPMELDKLVDDFIADGRKMLEVRHYGSFNQVQKAPMNLSGLKLPPGAVEVQIQMMLYDVLVYVPSKKDLSSAPVNQEQLLQGG